jgi:membrane-bound lytic murein transglycosylase C
VAKDGVIRVKVKVRFELLPNHLKIRAKKYHDLVDENSKRFMLQRQLILSVIHTESYFNPLAASHADAHGLMQLIPKMGQGTHTGWCMAATG